MIQTINMINLIKMHKVIKNNLDDHSEINEHSYKDDTRDRNDHNCLDDQFV